MRTEGRTDITKPTVAFRSFGKAPNKDKMQLTTISNFKNASLLISIHVIFFYRCADPDYLCQRKPAFPRTSRDYCFAKDSDKETLVATVMQCFLSLAKIIMLFYNSAVVMVI